MPIHEYKCEDCGSTVELLVGIGRNSDEVKCGKCGGSRLEKLMSATAGVVKDGPLHMEGSTCCGGNPSTQGCIPGSCCGASE
jgi:putative FmdB family regulatory protein